MLLLPLAEALAPSPRLALPNLRPCRTASIVMRPDNDPWTGERFSKVEGRPSTPKRSRDLQKALDAADAKLDALEAPTSWAALGEKPKVADAPAVPKLLEQAPIFLGVFALLLFVLNAIGVFGSGPELEALPQNAPLNTAAASKFYAVPEGQRMQDLAPQVEPAPEPAAAPEAPAAPAQEPAPEGFAYGSL